MKTSYAGTFGASKQAENIIARFGNPYKLSKALAMAANIYGNPAFYRKPSVIYRWAYPKARGGCDGAIPSTAIPGIVAAAKIVGLYLTDKELRP